MSKTNTAVTSQSSPLAASIYQELESRQAGVLATIGKDCKPQASVIYYSIEPDFTISFATKKDTLKNQNIERDGNVQLVVFEEKSQLTIQVTGKACEVKDEKSKSKIIERMYWISNQQDFSGPPISKLFAGEYVTYYILPTRITQGFFLRPQTGSYDMIEALDFN